MTPDLSLLQDFAVIMMVAAVVAVAFRRLNQPVVLGYLIAGYIVGSHSPPFSFVQNEEIVRELADFGIVLLMFGLGLEFSLDRIRKVGVVAVVGAATEVSAMIALGYFLGSAFGWTPMEAIFLGAALSISSTAIIIKVLQEIGRMDEESSRIMFGILVVEDFLAVAMMTVLAGVGGTGEISVAEVGQLGFRLILFTVVSLALGIRLLPKFIDLVAGMRSKEVLIVLTTGSAFAMAIFADALGLSIAAGAFIVGAVTAEARSAGQIHRLSEPVRDIFGALFFVAMGMLVALQVLREYVIPVVLIVLVVILGKMSACYLGVFVSGYRKRTALQVGTGMSQVGEFSLVISKIGNDTGATGAFMQPLMAVIAGVTAFTTPSLIRSTDRIYSFSSRIIPRVVKRRSNEVEFWARRVRAILSEDSSTARSARNALLTIALNVILIGAILFGAERVVGLLDDSALGWLAFLMGAGALLLCAPSVFAIWRALRTFFEAMLQRLAHREGSPTVMRRQRLMDTLPLATATVVVMAIVFSAIPLILRMLSVTDPMYLIPFGIAGLALVWLTWESLDRFHKRLAEIIALQPARRGEIDASSDKLDE